MELAQLKDDLMKGIQKFTQDAASNIGSNAWDSAIASGKEELQVMQQELVGKTQVALGNIEKIASKYKEMAHNAKLSTWSAALIVAIGVSCLLGYYVNWRIGQTMDETLARKFGQMFDTIDSYTKAIEKSTLEKVNKNVRK